MEKFRYFFLILTLICIVFYIFQLTIPGFENALILNSSALYKFQAWRFLTAIFLHASVLHIALNMFALLLFGFILEKKIGSKKFLIVFLSSGIIANLISVNFYQSSLGASGAIYGIIGALIFLDPYMMVFVYGAIAPMFIAGILWIIGNILEALGAFGDTNTGNIAHLSGIVVGILISIIFLKKYRKKQETKQKIILSEDYINKWEDEYIK